jgi:hypothetical protein
VVRVRWMGGFLEAGKGEWRPLPLNILMNGVGVGLSIGVWC